MPTLIVLSANRPSLDEAQEFVGGLVEVVELDTKDQMLVNEEGLLYNLPYNIYASRLAKRTIVGNAMILTGDAKWTEED